MIAVSFFAEVDSIKNLAPENGIFKGGSFRFLAVQLLGITAIVMWSTVVSFLQIYIIDKCIGMRVSLAEELLGADHCEHGITDSANLKRFSRLNGVKMRLGKTRQRSFAVKEPRNSYKFSFRKTPGKRRINSQVNTEGLRVNSTKDLKRRHVQENDNSTSEHAFTPNSNGVSVNAMANRENNCSNFDDRCNDIGTSERGHIHVAQAYVIGPALPHKITTNGQHDDLSGIKVFLSDGSHSAVYDPRDSFPNREAVAMETPMKSLHFLY